LEEKKQKNCAVTASSHTACQMPDTRLYQIPRGLRDCLPRSSAPPVPSSTRTTWQETQGGEALEPMDISSCRDAVNAFFEVR
jgi:hypothetical protein